MLASPASTSSLLPQITLPDGPEFSQQLALNMMDSSIVIDMNWGELIFSDKVDSVGDFDIRDGVPGL